MRYVPELGQAAFGNPWSEFDVDDLGSACIAHVLNEIDRVFWNRCQRAVSFDNEGDAEEWNACGSGVEWHAYWWGDEESAEAHRPNLSTGKTEVRWYKHPGRGESVNREMSSEDWREWLNEAMRRLRKADPALAGMV
jgi:hypothetical protein